MNQLYQKTLLSIAVVAMAFLIVKPIKATPQPDTKIVTSDRLDTLCSFRQSFAIDSDRIVTSPELRRFSLTVDSILKTDSVTFIDITGIASIDGPEGLNNRLSKARAESMAYWLKKTTSVDPSVLTISWIGEDWTWFEQLVAADPKVPAQQKVLEICRSKTTDISTKEAQLKKLDNGDTWRYLAANILPKMRVAVLDLGGYRRYIVHIEPEPEPEPEPVVEVVEEVIEETVEIPVEPQYDTWMHKLYIKSNAPAWLCLWINAAVEYDLAPHWSVALPIYYSGFNYFTRKLKFRTFAVVPELRWWTKHDNTGFFINVHAGMNLFNCAKGGEWRYQTYKGHTPALGGGVGIGYRWYFCKNHRWSMEAAVGAGVYKLDYSIFQNIPNGLIVGRKKRTFYGIDQAALSFAYSFGVKERKEVKK